MAFSILFIFIASLLTPFFYKKYTKTVGSILSLLLAGITIFFSSFIGPVSKGESFTASYSWIDSLHINLSFYLDGLSLFFALMICVFGLLVIIYSFSYLKKDEYRNRFFCYFLFFMGSMLGLVLSSNTICLFIFWELTSFSSFLLIGFHHQKKEARRAARQALLITAGGGLALLSGFIFLEIISFNGHNILDIIHDTQNLATSNLKVITIILILVGAASKSAQFPLHFWLPNAMAAPTPVSAYLHSATMVQAGVYLILRLNPLFDNIALWHHLLGITGAITMSWGAFKALQKDDLKSILAYTTISALGIFFMMIGLGGQEAINAVIIYILAHAFYKGALFLAAGSIDHQAGTRKVSQLSQLFKKMPYTSIAMLFCFASMAGVFPFLGFVGKESLYHVLYYSDRPFANIYLVLLFSASVFFTTVSIDVIYRALFGEKNKQKNTIKEAGTMMVLSPLVLALAGLLIGIFPSITVEPLLKWAAASTYAAGTSMSLKLWHGFNITLLLSVLTILCGFGLFFLLSYIRKFQKPQWLRADFLYDKSIHSIGWFAKFVTSIIQNGYLRNYITVVLITFSTLVIFIMADKGLLVTPEMSLLTSGVQIYELMILALITLAVIFLFMTKSRLIVTATFGIIGYSIALAYTLFSAPDVAITQFLAETLTLILLILILHRLPSYTLKKTIAHKKYLPVAILFGLVMSIVSYSILNYEKVSTLKKFFLENSVSEAKGQNAVNVILVDFRAFDTLGEITVLVITMIGVTALLKVELDKRKI